MTPVWYAAKVNSPKLWLAWLLLCQLTLAAPARALNGLYLPISAFPPGSKRACTAKSLRVDIDEASPVYRKIEHFSIESMRHFVEKTLLAGGPSGVVLLGHNYPTFLVEEGKVDVDKFVATSSTRLKCDALAVFGSNREDFKRIEAMNKSGQLGKVGILAFKGKINDQAAVDFAFLLTTNLNAGDTLERAAERALWSVGCIQKIRGTLPSGDPYPKTAMVTYGNRNARTP